MMARVGGPLVAAGLALLLLLPPFGAARELRALALTAIFAGALLDLLDRLRQGRSPAWAGGPAAAAWAIFLLGAWLTGPGHAEATERLATWAAVLVGAATLADRAGPDLLRALILLASILALQALAERLYLLEALREAARSRGLMPAPEQLGAFASGTRARGVFMQANGLAAFCGLLLPFAVARGLRSGAGRASALPFALLLLAALLASGSRGGALAAISGLAFLLVGRDRGSWPRLGRLLLSAAGLGWLLVLLVYLGGEALVDRSGAFATLLLRRDYALEALLLGTGNLPFGVGLELFGEAQPDQVAELGRFSRHAHQALLGLFAETGILVLSALAGLVLLLRGLLAATRERDGLAAPPRGHRAFPYLVLPALVLGVLSGNLALTTAGLLVELPLIGALAFALDRLVAGPLAAADRSGDRKALACGVLALLLHAQIDFDLRISSLLAATAMVAALALRRIAAAGAEKPGGRGRTFAGWAIVVLLLFATGLLQLGRPIDLRGLRDDARSGRVERIEAARRELLEAPAKLRELPGYARLARSLGLDR
ncbi:MAG: hypothetical protein H6807_13535 [Planctomycetes bacterium]|nr:hypothetical protein [Planctomycetota bacterium]